MSKRIVVTALCLSLSACTVTEPGTPQSTPTNNSKEIGDARSGAVKLCNFLPTVGTIIEILDLGLPGLSKGVKIANAICEKVKEGKKGEIPKINGVRIKGEFVR